MPSLVFCPIFTRFKFRATNINGEYTDSEYSEHIRTGTGVLRKGVTCVAKPSSLFKNNVYDSVNSSLTEFEEIY